MRPGSRRPRPLLTFGFVAFVMIAVTSLATSCFLFPKKKSAKKSPAAGGLIITQEGNLSAIYFDRIGDGDTARLQFKTTQPALCQLAYYSQDPEVEPKKDAPKVQPCAEGPARTEFTEKLEGLRTDTLYEVVITAWVDGTTKEQGESITVRETASNIEEPTLDGKLKDLLVARFNIPLKVAEVHRHTLPEPTDLPTLKARLNRQLGCRQGVPANEAAFREAAAEVGIKSLATRDFAAGSAANHPESAGRLQLVYPTLNDGLEKWTLLYQIGEKDVSVPARPMSRILNMEMESTDIMAFEEPQLAEAADPLVIDATKPLKFAWTTGTLIDQSYMTIQIGRPEQEKAIYCVFPASKLSGVVEPALLAELEDGRHVVSAELNSNQLWAKDGWLISVFDWRSARIEK